MLDSETAAFMRGPVTLVLGARDHNHLATAVYCLGCRTDLAAGTVSLLVDRARAKATIDNLCEHPSAALVVCRPTTLRTLQLKGTDARVEPAAPEDGQRAAAYVEMLVAELAQVGDPEEWTRAAFDFAAADIVAVTFTPAHVYVQTPGPSAGEPIAR